MMTMTGMPVILPRIIQEVITVPAGLTAAKDRRSNERRASSVE
jgi:hypothetical protein